LQQSTEAQRESSEEGEEKKEAAMSKVSERAGRAYM
jgi:hypothetical protein